MVLRMIAGFGQLSVWQWNCCAGSVSENGLFLRAFHPHEQRVENPISRLQRGHSLIFDPLSETGLSSH